MPAHSTARSSEHICEVCGKTFIGFDSRANRFCGRACMNIGMRVTNTKVCPVCGITFVVKAKKTQCCSMSCGQKNRAKPSPIPDREGQCVRCGKTFKIARRESTGRYCSRACSDATKKNLGKPWNKVRCAYCGKEFLREPWRPDIKCCSMKCGKRLTALTVVGENHPLYKPKVIMYCEVCGKRCEVKPSLVDRFRACSRHCVGVLATLAQAGRRSSIEYTMEDQFERTGLAFDAQLAVGRWLCDFAFPEHRLIVECDGDYWHNLPKCKARDARKDRELKALGWRVLRLTESAIKASPQRCLHEVLVMLHGSSAPELRRWPRQLSFDDMSDPKSDCRQREENHAA